jgi:integrase
MTYRSLRSAASQNAPWLQTTGNPITPETPFAEAADLWVGSLLLHVRETTVASYRQYVDNLKLFFINTPLGDIRLDRVYLYQECRLAGKEPFIRQRRPIKSCEVAPCPTGARKVNQEVGVLKRILRTAKVWGEEHDRLHKSLLEKGSEIPRALTIEEQRRWLQVAKSSLKWHVVYYYSDLAFATCMSTNEIRSLRLGDIHLEAGYIDIPPGGSKNKYRQRLVRIGREGWAAYHAVEWLLRRAHDLGAKEQHHHLFPFRRNPQPFDPTRPMTGSGLKKLWQEVRIASGLKWFRLYDTRHTAITRLAEEGSSITTIMKMAGHVSVAMSEHYTHISERDKDYAMEQVQARVRGVEQPEPLQVVRQKPARPLPPRPSAPTLPAAPPPSVSAFPAAGFSAAGSSFFLNSFTIGKGAING